MVKGVVIGFLLAVVFIAGAVFSYFASGMAPVATADPPMPFEKKLANMALDAHIEKQHVVQSPVAADEPAFLAGAGVYKEQCAACHTLAHANANGIGTSATLSPSPCLNSPSRAFGMFRVKPSTPPLPDTNTEST